MSSSPAADKQSALAVPAAETDKEEVVFQAYLPRGIRKMKYTDPVTGGTVWEPFWFLQASMFIAVLGISIWTFQMSLEMDTEMSWLFFGLPILLAIITAGQYRPQKAVVTRKGISYRSDFAIGGHTVYSSAINRLWPDLECIRFVSARNMSDAALALCGRCDSLALDWRVSVKTPFFPSSRTNYGVTSYINLWALTDAQREELFAALSQVVPQELLAPEVLYLQVKALSGTSTQNINDFTHVWLEEYNRRFEISNYVPLPPGSSLGEGRFTVRMLIAARVNSSTYLAQTRENRRVVIKELVAPLDSDDSMQKKLLEQFNRESAILAGLDHPSIVLVIDHFIENGRSYIVMEQAAGKNMREYVRLRGSLPEAEVVPIAGQLVSVLQYLHQHTPAILHRDFTPDNMIYDESGKITVIDFGAANVYNTGKTATLIGKQGFMPPEQLRGKPLPASDIYALGATLSFFLSGRDMLNMATLPDFAEGTVSPGMVDLLRRCVDMDAQKRPDCDQINESLKAVQTGSPAMQSQGEIEI